MYMYAYFIYWFMHQLCVHQYFSNSLIINDNNTMEIDTVKKVLISCLNLHRFGDFIPLFSPHLTISLRSYIKHSKSVSPGIQKPCSELKTLGCTLFFNPILCVSISDETLFLLFDILHEALEKFGEQSRS